MDASNAHLDSDSLFQSATLGDWFAKLDILSNLALPEVWSYKNPIPDKPNVKTPILENYILHTFKRLVYERNAEQDDSERNKIIYVSSDCSKMCFNTGLYTKQYQEIYACFTNNTNKSKPQYWFLIAFNDNSSPFFTDIINLPRRARYFTDINELIYDANIPLRVNSSHILSNANNKMRIPEDLRGTPNLLMLFDGAIDLAKKIVASNYKAAVPQYYDNSICLLLPVCLRTPEKADLSLAVKKRDGFYTGATCLTLDMAYNNARLIACPNSDWLKP